MAIVDYGTLKTAVATRLSRADLTALIPDFVDGGLKRCNLELAAAGGITDQEQIAFTDTVVDQDSYEQPADYQSLRYIKVTSLTDPTIQPEPLESCSYDMLIDLYADNTGLPEKYTIIDGSFVMRPIPDAVYRITIGYMKRYNALVNDTDSNWLISQGGNALFYASLLEAAPHIQDDNAIQRWGLAYKEAMKLVITADRRSKRGPKPAGLQVDPALPGLGNSWSIVTG